MGCKCNWNLIRLSLSNRKYLKHLSVGCRQRRESAVKLVVKWYKFKYKLELDEIKWSKLKF